jgi:hypothetical protein
MTAAHEIVETSSDASQGRNFGHIMLVSVATEMQNMTKPARRNSEEFSTRENLAGVAFSPMRRKRSSSRMSFDRDFIEAAPGQIGCLLVGFNSQRSYLLKMGSSSLELTPVGQAGHPKTILFDNVKFLFNRNGRNSIEIFLISSKTYLLKFSPRDFPAVIQPLQAARFKRAEIVSLAGDKLDVEEIQRRWVAKECSTFEYLMKLNVLSGRSFRDAACYPVMPRVLLDVKNPTRFVSQHKRNSFPDNMNPITKITSVPDAVCGGALVMPDFFFDPAIYPADFALPKWASSRFELAYRLRRALESDAISKILPQWIDHVFGVKCQTSEFTYRLFLREHPARPLTETPPVPASEIRIGQQVKSAVVYSLTATSFHFGFLCGERSVVFLKGDFSTGKLKHEMETIGLVPTDLDRCYWTDYRWLLAFTKSESRLRFIKPSKELVQYPLYCQSSLIARFGKGLVLCSERCCISIATFKSKVSTVTPVCYIDADIVVIAASFSFQIIAFATSDGFVHIRSARNGASILKYDPKREINHILITENWGFVIAFSSEQVFIFTVNGEFVKTRALSKPLLRAFAHSTFTGFDFVSLTTADESIFVFDPMYPEKGSLAVAGQAGIVKVVYDPYRNSLFTVSEAGFVRNLPLTQRVV